MPRIAYLAVAVVVAFALGLVAARGPVAAAATENPDCWGAATAVFAQTGEMGAHASEQEEPRLGLANLARIPIRAARACQLGADAERVGRLRG